MKRYKSQFEEDSKIMLKNLLDNKGKIINKKGYAIEGIGIFDNEGKEYIAGYDKYKVLYASNVDENNYVLDFEGNRINLKIK